jgi:hypothetical protein
MIYVHYELIPEAVTGNALTFQIPCLLFGRGLQSDPIGSCV